MTNNHGHNCRIDWTYQIFCRKISSRWAYDIRNPVFNRGSASRSPYSEAAEPGGTPQRRQTKDAEKVKYLEVKGQNIHFLRGEYQHGNHLD